MEICKIDEVAVRIAHAGCAENLLTTLETRRIEVLAHCCVPAQSGALWLVVTEKPRETAAVVEQGGLKCQTNPVVLVRTPSQPAIAARLGMHLTAARLGIRYCYATWRGATNAHIVFKTTDDDHAVCVLQACMAGLNELNKRQPSHPG
jgi:hypothetical protein